MRALVTGGSGFAGTALHAHLLTEGDHVVAWSRADGGPDITDRPAVFDQIEDAQPEVIYHLAAQAHVPTAWSDPIGTLRVNVEGTQNVLDAAAALGNVRVIVISSAEIYGSVPGDRLPITETTPLAPSNPYAASKAAADTLAISARTGSGVDVIRMRPFNHFGPGQSPNFVSAGFAHRIAVAAKEGTRSIPVGNLDVRRDFCDVRDVVRAYRSAAESGAAGEVYNVCSGVDRSIREIAEALVAASGADVTLVESAELVRPSDTPRVVGSAERITRQTGWSPKIPFEQSIDDIYQDAVGRTDSNEDARDTF